MGGKSHKSLLFMSSASDSALEQDAYGARLQSIGGFLAKARRRMKTLCSYRVSPGYWEMQEPTQACGGRGRGGKVGLRASGAERVGTADELRVRLSHKLSSLLRKKVAAKPLFSAAIDEQRWKQSLWTPHASVAVLCC